MDFEDKVFQVLRNFMEYGNYQGKVDKAVRVIQKSFPDKSREELTLIFEILVNAYKEAILLVKENKDHYSLANKSQLEAEIQFRKKYDQVSEKMLTWIIGWVHHWYHER